MKNILHKSSLLAVFISVLLVAACDKDGDGDPVLPGLKCFLQSTSFTSTDYQTVVAFTYGSDGKVLSFEWTYTAPDGQGGTYTSVLTMTATYDGNGRISKLDASNGSRYEFTYDANGKVTKEDDYEGADNNSRTVYIYNSGGQLVREDTYLPQNGSLEKVWSENYEYANTSGSNPTRVTTYDPSGTPFNYYVDYLYDDKPTPYSELHLPPGISGSAGAPVNNVTKRTTKTNSGSVENTTTYTYQYNADGYPTSLEETMTFPNSPNGYTNTDTYIYDCK